MKCRYEGKRTDPTVITRQKGGIMRDTGQKVREVNATMAMEGMPLTDEDKDRLRDIFEDRTTVEKTVQTLIQKHAQKRTVHERI
jgi:hypothetical protein